MLFHFINIKSKSLSVIKPELFFTFFFGIIISLFMKGIITSILHSGIYIGGWKLFYSNFIDRHIYSNKYFLGLHFDLYFRRIFFIGVPFK